jgi:hypothetical protein
LTKGIVITNWTEDQGLVAQISYPEDFEVDLDDMMRIFYAHITGAGEAGNVLVRLEKAKANVSSYFTGMESDMQYMINLMLDLGEDPEMFGESIITQMNNNILLYLKKLNQYPNESYDTVKELRNYMKNSLLFLERLKNLSKEQILAQIYTSDKGRIILELLQERAMSKREIQNKLEEKTGRIITNLDTSLDPFIKTDVLRQDWIEGDPDVTLFLQSDFSIIRTPAEKLVEDAKKGLPNPQLANKYLELASNFFTEYEPSHDDSLKIAKHMINPDVFDFVVLFRERAYPINKIPKGPGESFDKVKNFLDQLENDHIVAKIDDSGIEWVFLLTDITAEEFYPEYLIENIRKSVSEDNLKKETAVKHLELLERVYVKEK